MSAPLPVRGEVSKATFFLTTADWVIAFLDSVLLSNRSGIGFSYGFGYILTEFFVLTVPEFFYYIYTEFLLDFFISRLREKVKF